MAGKIRIIRLEGSPEERGRLHGELHRDGIRRYTEERVKLAANGSWAGRPATVADILALAEDMLPAHRAYSPDLTAEMEAMAHAAGISAAEAVIVGGFTDFVDAVRALGSAKPPEEDDCTAVVAHEYLCQTWDMHDSATPHVVMLDVRDEIPALIFTTEGCLAQIGMNAAGIAIGINNLVANDGRVGVTWPFVVRKVLQCKTIESALACVLEARLSGAHNYLLLDAQGHGYNIEAMPTHAAVVPLGDEPLAHTNHCIDPEALRRQAERAPALLESSQGRLQRAMEIAPQSFDLDALIGLTRDRVICRRSEEPYHIESSGAVVMRPATRDFWAVWGIPADHEYERFVVG
ncbi:MAG TPA: C45 family autoproteolytic acyltransferase/hydrolase [Polyangium sp.]|nr:C45 family autoproteolytic acyltransferase/hydrolase [Polyangium sp.]